jgi:hypothetical protein
MTLTEGTLCCFSNSGKCFWEKGIKVFTGGKSGSKSKGKSSKVGIAHRRDGWLTCIYFGSHLLEISNSAAFACAQDLI